MSMTREATGAPGQGEPVVDALMRASRALASITARSLASVNEEVTLTQFGTLVVLSERGPQTVTALAEHLDVHASTMTRMCTRLVSRGLVVRVPSAVDRREVVITLSPAGARLVEEVRDTRKREFDNVVGRMTVGDQQVVIDACHAFASAAGDDMGIRSGDGMTPEHAQVAPEDQ
jgi:DNA-binding MarR family transcriptional regulator